MSEDKDQIVGATDYTFAPTNNVTILAAIQVVLQRVAEAEHANLLRITQMSGTLEQQLQALTAALATDLQAIEQQLQALTAALATDLQAISSGVSQILANMQPGTALQQSDIDALDAVKTAADTASAQIAAALNPPAPPAAP